MKEKIIQILEGIIHPATEKGIVSSGIVDNVSTSTENISITLAFPKNRDPFMNSIKRQIIEQIGSAFPEMEGKISVMIKVLILH